MFLLAIVIIILYARYVGTMGFITKEHTIYSNSITDGFDGLKVVHFSDIHYNRAITSKKIDSIVEEINLINVSSEILPIMSSKEKMNFFVCLFT